MLVEAVVLELRPDLPVVDEGDDRVGVLELLERLLDAVGDLLAVDRVLEGLRRGGPEVAQVRREQTVRADFEAILVVAERDERVRGQFLRIVLLQGGDALVVAGDELLRTILGAGGGGDEFEVLLPGARTLVADRDDRGDGFEFGADRLDVLGPGDDEVGGGADDRLEVDLVVEEQLLGPVLLGRLEFIADRGLEIEGAFLLVGKPVSGRPSERTMSRSRRPSRTTTESISLGTDTVPSDVSTVRVPPEEESDPEAPAVAVRPARRAGTRARAASDRGVVVMKVTLTLSSRL